MMGRTQADLNQLITICKESGAKEVLFDGHIMTWVVPDSLVPALEKASESCPACMLAAIRQSGIPVPAVQRFDFSARCKEEWAEFNEAQREYDENDL